MAVYTPLTKEDTREFLSQYDIGELVDIDGIAEGISNSNFLLSVKKDGEQKNYILTLFEKRTNIEELPYFTALMEWLCERGVHCPQPVAMSNGRKLAVLKEKPALIVSFLEGSSVRKITPEHVKQVGALAARMHIAGMEFPYERSNGLSVKGWEGLIDGIDGRADEIEPGLQKLIDEEFNYLSEHWPDNLPRGPVHADLFPDNVFFDKTFGKAPVLSGVIDFYFACNDAWAYDLAICVNAWCFDERHRFSKERTEALMWGYHDLRPLTTEEEAAFPLLLRGAALRFLLTRTYDWLHTPKDALVTLKDPKEYALKLQFHQNYEKPSL